MRLQVKRREGTLDRIDRDGRGAIGRGLFKKETDTAAFVGMQAHSVFLDLIMHASLFWKV